MRRATALVAGVAAAVTMGLVTGPTVASGVTTRASTGSSAGFTTADDPPPLPITDPKPWTRPGKVAPGAYRATPAPLVQAAPTTAGSGSAADTPTRVTPLVAHSAWSWYMDPRVMATSKATYFGSVANNGDIQVTSVDRGTARLRHAVVHPRFQADDHNAPT
ncbi:MULTISPECIES: hypothetical protein [unclassified Janibacter]|uniref:hypothetical protein n=1 Tax=unclassified Janibacter TaxID=2649294 RepID=UPI003D08F86F